MSEPKIDLDAIEQECDKADRYPTSGAAIIEFDPLTVRALVAAVRAGLGLSLAPIGPDRFVATKATCAPFVAALAPFQKEARDA